MGDVPDYSTDDIAIVEVSKVFRTGLFRSKTAVENLTLNVPRGHIVGLLGPNGSGKSTTLKMIVGFLRPTQGEILLCGSSSSSRLSRELIGYLPENPRFQRFLTAREVMHYYGKLFRITGRELSHRADELLEMVGLKHAAKERVQGFSKGMTQRLAIAQALLNRPRLLIFDEPMSGLDPLGRMEIRSLVSRIHEEMPQSTIFFSTHILGDVEALCSHVALLRSGKLATYCAIDELLTSDDQRFDLVLRGLPPELLARYQRENQAKPTPLGLSLTLSGTEKLVAELEELKRVGAAVVGISSHRRNLEEALFGGRA